jgi:hypothetical protein
MVLQEIVVEGSGEAARAVGVRLADGRVYRRVLAALALPSAVAMLRPSCLHIILQARSHPRKATAFSPAALVKRELKLGAFMCWFPLQGQDCGQQRDALGHV